MGPAVDTPEVTNTLDDDTTGGVAGTYEAALVADVESGVQYGAGGTEFTGTLVVTGTPDIFFLQR